MIVLSAYGKLTQNKEKQFNVKFGFGRADSKFLSSKNLVNATILSCESDSSHCYEYLMKKSRYTDSVPGDFPYFIYDKIVFSSCGYEYFNEC